MVKKFHTTLFFIFFIVCSLFSQNYDSLLKILPKIKEDTEKIKIYNKLSSYYENTSPDSAFFYTNSSILLSKKLIKESEINSKRVYELLIDSYTRRGFYYIYQFKKYKAINYLDSAKKVLDSLTKIHKNEKKHKIKKIEIWGGYAHIYLDAGEYSEALKYYQKIIKLREKLIKNKKITENQLVGDYFNLGLVHYYLENYEKALDYYQKTLTITIKNKHKIGEAMCYNNIGIVYLEQNRFNLALKYFNKSLKIAKENNAVTLMAQNYDNLGEVFFAKKNYQTAEKYYKKSLELAKKLGNIQGIVFIQNNLSDLNMKKGDYNTALEYAKKGLENALKIEALKQISISYKMLSEVYEKMGNFKKSLKNYKNYYKYHDSVFNVEKNKQIEEMESKYQFHKNKQEIKNQKLEIAKSKETIKRKNWQRNAMIAVIILVFIILIIVFRNYKIKEKINKELKERNIKINLQKEEISTQAENLKEANFEISEQKKELEKRHQQITASITYASKIQNAITPFIKDFEENFKEYFLIFRPRDVVSGDFYWFMKLKDKMVFAAVDCTGHGVPGAFLSMLGVSLLNEIVAKNTFKNAADILENLRKKVKKVLHQKGDIKEQKDGMDIALCVIDNKKEKLDFSGAHNPLYLIRNNELKIYKHTKNPISISIVEKEFINHKIDLKQNDLLYIFSDGFKDQFNKQNVKIGAKKFKEILLNYSSLKMINQKQKLTDFFDDWKISAPQTDDVLVIGLKI